MSADTPVLYLQLPPDRTLSCQHCGIAFVWTGWEQRRQAQKPEHCPGCRRLLAVSRRWGVVKWFDARKGFGFITMTDGTDIFVRRRDVIRGDRLRKGKLVSFRVKEGKNKRAIKVRAQRPQEKQENAQPSE